MLKTEMPQLTVRLPKSFIQKVKRLAKAKNESMNTYMETLLRKHVSSKK